MDLLSWRVFQTCDFLNIIYEIQDLFYFYKNCLFNDKLKDFSCFLLIHKRNLKKIFKNSYNTPVISNKYFLSNYIIFLRHTFSILSHILLGFHKFLKFFFTSMKSYKNRMFLLLSKAGEILVVLYWAFRYKECEI